MKEFVVILSLFLIQPALAQDINNFRIVGSTIEWHRSLPVDTSINQYVLRLKGSGNFQNIEVNENTILAEIKAFSPDFKGAGYKRMYTPIYILSSFYSGFLVIRYNRSQAEITIKKIVATEKTDWELGKMGEKTELEEYGLKKNNFTSVFRKDGSKILDYSFGKLFE
jgi:hypothetical protein